MKKHISQRKGLGWVREASPSSSSCCGQTSRRERRAWEEEPQRGGPSRSSPACGQSSCARGSRSCSWKRGRSTLGGKRVLQERRGGSGGNGLLSSSSECSFPPAQSFWLQRIQELAGKLTRICFPLFRTVLCSPQAHMRQDSSPKAEFLSIQWNTNSPRLTFQGKNFF